MQARGICVRSFLVDIDQTALDYALELASRHGVADRVTVLKGSVSQVARISQGFQPHIIEMLGLLDYIPEAKAIKLLSKIRETLPVGGTFFTCNIHPNLEQLFLQWVINWPMLYRTKEQLASIVERAGFGAPRLVSEPLGLHTLAISTKGKEGA